MNPRITISNHARDVGFHVVRFTRARPTPHADALDGWVARGAHADMVWIPRGRDVRRDPRHRVPWARGVVALAVTHHHRRPADPGGRTGLVARYAWGRDYHNLVGKRLRKLQRRLDEAGIRSWGGVDTAPILERPWANAAGLGFTGKNTLQIIPGRTSWMFLAILFVDAEVEPDGPVGDHCGRCTRCLVGCPTQAFRGPRDLDARRCVAYWTIEARGLAPEALLPSFGRWVFGCDVCQEVCPHNHDPEDPDEADLAPRHAWLDLDEVVRSTDETLLARFAGTPLRRPGAAGLKRNALVALGNLGDADAAAIIHDHGLRHPSPVVRQAASWAIRRLDPGPRAAPRDP